MILLWALLAAQDLPKVPADWKVEVVANAPRVQHPSIVACAPDGRVFVGEDPMDIRVPAHSTQGRILCFHPDGRVTVFAEGLHAPFGLMYLEGFLYVHHSPRFSRFADGGDVGKDRVDLLECTNPKPWALDWNDHVPANVRLAMDGHLYMSVGDKGVYGCVGRDGKPAELHGGGVLRLRPDATALEVFSTGTRNHLDVAINAEDDVFTYDNTDEKHWWSRVTHMVEGGYYGYPWDHVPARPWILPCAAEYGAGAATATVCYEEDALPEEYRGNLFLADFGKREILRLRIAREGATYRVVARERFVHDAPPGFRPVGLAIGADGLSFYIGDWNHRDNKENVVAGRLIKVSYTGKSLAAPKPAWYLPAAIGRPFEATTDELVAGLSHPSHSVRLTAQRRLSDRRAIEPLIAVLSGGAAAAKRHAVWALDAIDGGVAGRKAIVAALGDPAARLQALKQLGLRRVKEARDAFIALLKDPDAAMRFHAATALGRLADPAAVPPLLEALDEKDPYARFAAWTALGRIGRAEPASWPPIASGIQHGKAAIREGSSFAMREAHDERLVAELAKTARSDSTVPEARATALGVLSGLHRKTKEWKGEWWAYHPVNLPRPARDVDWAGTAAALAAIRAGLDDAQPSVRRAAVDGLIEGQDAESTEKLRALFGAERDGDVRHALFRALVAFKAPGVEGLIAAALGDARLRDDALAAAEELRATAVLVRHLASRPADRARAIDALSQAGGEGAGESVAAFLRDDDLATRVAAIRAVARLRHPPASGALLEAFAREETRFEAASALAAMPDPRAIDAYLYGVGGPSTPLRNACGKALRSLEGALAEIEKRATAGTLPAAAVAELQKVFSGRKAQAPRLFAIEAKRPDPAAYLEHAMKSRGDAERGRKLFMDAQGVACVKCHRVGREGGEVGPDLSGAGAQFGRRELAESVLYPSKAVREGYQQTIVRLKDGRVLTGSVRAESADEFTLLDVDGHAHRVRKAAMEARKTSDTSLMPDGLEKGLSPDDFADLVSYLESLRGGAK